MDTFLPSRWVWTMEDFDAPPVADRFIHGIGFDGHSLLFDIDFVVHSEPDGTGKSWTYWYAPATLRFENVTDCDFRLNPHGGLIFLDTERSDPGTNWQGQRDWHWHLYECCSEGFAFRATGYSLIIRAPGRLPGRHAACLSLEERGGISFSTVTGQT